MSDELDQSQPLPSELIAAIHRVRQQTATPEMVAKATSKAVELNRSVNPISHAARPRTIPLRWATGLAALLVLATTAGLFTYRFAIHVDHPVRLQSHVTHSPVTKSSLVLVGYRRVDEDMDRADAKVEVLTEALEMAMLRREIQITLDDFYDWSDRK